MTLPVRGPGSRRLISPKKPLGPSIASVFTPHTTRAVPSTITKKNVAVSRSLTTVAERR